MQQQIENHPVYKKVISDSFGGVMYDIANRDKYDSAEILGLWDRMTDSQKDACGGIMKGAISFLKGDEV